MPTVNLLGDLALDTSVTDLHLPRGEVVAAGHAGIAAMTIRTDADAATADNLEAAMMHTDEEGRLKVSSKTASFPDVTGSTAAVAATVVCDVKRASNVTVHVKGGAVAATGHNYAFEASSDSTNGTDGTWYAVQVARTNANTIETTTGTLALAIGVGTAYAWEGSVNAYKWFRVRCTARTAGTLDWIIVRGSYATEPVPAIQAHAVTISGTPSVNAAITSMFTGNGYLVTTTASTNAAAVKASSGSLYELTVSNPTASPVYVKLYNKTTAPVPGTDTPLIWVAVPAGATVAHAYGAAGKRFATGIGVAVVGGAALLDATNAVAGAVVSATYA